MVRRFNSRCAGESSPGKADRAGLHSVGVSGLGNTNPVALRCVGGPAMAAGMIRGSCLCGGIRFELRRAVGPFELCHCRRCRKVSGSAFVAGLGVQTEDYRLLEGKELIRSYEAPIRERPPAYRTSFCGRCGSPVPNPSPDSTWFELPAGLLEDGLLEVAPELRPDRHIFVEFKAPWFEIRDGKPQLDQQALARFRRESKADA